MKSVRLLAVSISCAWGAALSAATLHFAGDSTLDDGGRRERPPYESWGTELEFSMKSGNCVRNLAKSGHSTKSFEADGYWAKLIAGVKPGDFVGIQFGHNDQKRSTDFYREKRWADPKGLFREIVRRWVGEIRAKGATPILLSPICRGTFDKDDRTLTDGTHASDGVCLRSYRDAMEDLSRELSCDYVDMNGLTRDLMQRLGKEESHKFFVISTGLVRGKDGEPAQDVTHPVKTGAEAFANLFIRDVIARKLPVAALFRTQDFPITAYGAKTDGSKCTEAFARAMEAASKAGGGRVVVSKGRWFSGAIHFKSHCELHLEEGAEIVFSQDPADYLPAVHTTWEGMECQNYSPLVFAYCCTNVAITGKGTLRAYDGEWKDTAWYKWVPQANGVREARLQLYNWGATDFPVEKREIWKRKNAHTRPHLLQFNRCVGVRWHDFKVRNSPFWTTHLYLCNGASVRGLDVCAHGNNNDGIDVEMSRNVLIEKCRFDQGDDGIVIKSGRNRDAWRLAKPTENVFVRDCEIVNAHTLLGIGSEISGGVRNVTLRDCTGGDIYRVIFIKTNHRRGAFVEGINVENVHVGKSREAVFAIGTDVLYEWASFPEYERKLTRIRDISLKGVFCTETKRCVDIAGDEGLPVENVRLEGVTARKASEKDRVVNAKDVKVLP